MHVTVQFCSKTGLGDEIVHHKLALHNEFMALFWYGPLGTNLTHILSVNTLTDSDFAFLAHQTIYLLDRNQIISHSVNKSEIHPALSEIAKFISLSIIHPIINLLLLHIPSIGELPKITAIYRIEFIITSKECPLDSRT